MSGLTRSIAISFAVALFFSAQALFWVYWSRRQRREELLRARLRGHQEVPDEGALRIRRRGREEVAATGIERIALVQRWRVLLIEAGYEVPVRNFVFGLFGAAGAGFLLVSMVAASLFSGMVFGAIIVFGVQLFVTRRRDARLRQLDEQLPRALEIMVFSLRAGRSLEDAVRSAGEEVDDPLAAELLRCHEEYTFGRPIERALQQLRARWPSVRSLYAFVEAVAVLKRTGGNMVDVMNSLIETLQAQAIYEARHRALTSEGRLSGTILMALPLASLASQMLLAPQSMAQMFADPVGRNLLMLAAGLWVAGIFWIGRLSRPTRGAA